MANHFTKTGNFYVSAIGGNDSNDGSANAPFKTISAGVAAAEAAGSGYGQTVVIGSGIYNERIVANNTTDYLCIQGDGNVVIDGTDLTDSLIYQGYFWHYKNMTFINHQNFYAGGSSVTGTYSNCTFKNVLNFANGNFNSNGGTSRNMFNDCRWFNCNTTSIINYKRYFHFRNCVFFNGHWFWDVSNGNYNGSALGNTFSNCLFSNPSGSHAYAQYYSQGYGAPLQNCVFQNDQKLTMQQNGFTNVTITNDNINQTGITGCVVASMSFNDNITGSGNFSGLNFTMPLNSITKDLYSNSGVIAALGTLGDFPPRTAYGDDSSSANPLHTAGGATWVNIVTGSLGGFQIGDGTGGATGSIVTAVIDQGGSRVIKNIGSSFTTLAPNAAALSTHPSGSLNHNPTRYQFEMKYGNNSDLSSNEYKIFEFDQTPYVNSNGTGSGDQLFDTGSFTNVSGRYLQLRITLRTDMSGSA